MVSLTKLSARVMGTHFDRLGLKPGKVISDCEKELPGSQSWLNIAARHVILHGAI